MTPQTLTDLTDGTLLVADDPAADTIHGAYATDWMADALAHAPEGAVLLTLQNRAVAAGIAVERHLSAILLCGGRTPKPALLAHCRREHVALLCTPLDTFAAAARIATSLPPR